jgi:hypothetical protein
LDVVSPIGASIIGLGVATLICTFVSVGLACKAGYDHSFAPAMPLPADHGVIELQNHEVTNQDFKLQNHQETVVVGEPVNNSARQE